eukprot:UN25377
MPDAYILGGTPVGTTEPDCYKHGGQWIPYNCGAAEANVYRSPPEWIDFYNEVCCLSHEPCSQADDCVGCNEVYLGASWIFGTCSWQDDLGRCQSNAIRRRNLQEEDIVHGQCRYTEPSEGIVVLTNGSVAVGNAFFQDTFA